MGKIFKKNVFSDFVLTQLGSMQFTLLNRLLHLYTNIEIFVGKTPIVSCHVAHRQLSSYWLAHFYFDEKSACSTYLVWIGEFWNFLRAVSQEQLMSLPHFWSTVRLKRSWFEHMQTVIQTSRRLD
jgi:hypothetical protein